MKKVCFILLVVSGLAKSQQFTATEFISFSKKDFETKKEILKNSKWKFVREKKNENDEVYVYKYDIFRDMSDSIIVRKIFDPSTKKRNFETEYISTNESIYPWRTWYSEMKSMYPFTYLEGTKSTYGKSVYKDKDLNIMMMAYQPKEWIVSRTMVITKK
ncbi:hypothetical protein [Chryseobacterium indologenes]|uniref:Uncharacterized protein n=1 Tax=Chryseobacterium indologenes TaxID=253 RepID=A0A0N0IV35_CHRID|nr:hypothetical protein [Chryseobacterium indologenes]KPE50112.1 hypothetical protein AOB46_16875 [Chryseobacterium indologenes]